MVSTEYDREDCTMQDTETVLNVISKKADLTTGEPDAVKAACPVRRGGRRKSAPITRSNSPAAYPTRRSSRDRAEHS